MRKMSNQVLVRDIDRLDISREARNAARELIELIDMPIVFDMDARGDKSVAGRMPGKHNQFWVTVVKGFDKKETERIILAHLFRGVMETLRYPTLKIEDSFIRKLLNQNKRNEISSLREFGSAITSFVSSIICECFLDPYKIKTGAAVRLRNQNHILKKWEKRSENKKKLSKFKRNDFKYILLVLHSANQARVSPDFDKQIISLINRKFPYNVAQKICEDIYSFKQLIQNTFSEFNKGNGAFLSERLYEKIISSFKLQTVMQIVFPFAYKIGDNDELQRAKMKDVLSFVPEDIDNYKFFIKCVRYANSAIVLSQEYSHYILDEELPDVQVYVGMGSKANAYANNDEKNGGSITFTYKMFKKLKWHADNFRIKTEIEDDSRFVSECRERMLKLLIFFITLHEYSHIISGDCNTNLHQDLEHENHANCSALIALKRIIPYQYRPGETPFDYQTAKYYVFTRLEISLIPDCMEIVNQLQREKE